MKQEYGKIYQRKIDIPIALALAIGYLVVLLGTTDIGFCRDEGYYFSASKTYITWVEKLAVQVARKPKLNRLQSQLRRNTPIHKKEVALLQGLVHELRLSYKDKQIANAGISRLYKRQRLTHAQRRQLVKIAVKGSAVTALTRKEIRRYWRENSEHPPLAKLLMGASWWLFANKLKWMSNATGFRFPGMLWTCLMVLLIYIWGTRVWNRRVGLFAAFAFMLLPRMFFHAHLAAFDVPVAALWLLVCYAFWRGMKSSAWGWWCGIFFGLALATKHNSWILPFPIAFYWLCQVWTKFRFKFMNDGTYQIRFAPLPNAFYSALFFGPLIAFALWPLLWPADFTKLVAWKETWSWLTSYVGFHMKHVHYDAYYFGTLYVNNPPFPVHFPFSMTAVTFPLVTVVLTIAGIWFLTRQQRLGSHIIWWTVQVFKFLISALKPVLGIILNVILLVSSLFVGAIMALLYLLEGIGSLFHQGLANRFSSLRKIMYGNIWQELQDLNQWRTKVESIPREYKHRPVGPADKTGLFWLLNASVPIMVIALPNTPIFGGTKHWMPAWPFLALIAAVAFERILTSLYNGWLKGKSLQTFRIATVSLGILLLLPAFIGMVRVHPHGLAYYNTLVGGPRGSANWKLQRSYWGFSMRQAVPWMNTKMKGERRSNGSHDSTIWVEFHDTNNSSYRMYCKDGHLRCGYGACSQKKDKRPCIRPWWWDPERVRYHAFVHQKWLRTQLYHILSVIDSRTPAYGVYVDDVPLLTFWEKGEKVLPVWW